MCGDYPEAVGQLCQMVVTEKEPKVASTALNYFILGLRIGVHRTAVSQKYCYRGIL